MSIWLYRRELQGGDAYIYANDALREKVPLSMTVSCTLEQLRDTLASIIEDDRILFEMPFPLNTQMPYYNYLKQLFPNSYTQANVTQSIDGVNYYSGSWNLLPSGNEGYYHSWCQAKRQYNSGDLHDVCTVISHYSYNSVNSSNHIFSIHLPVWGTQDIDYQHNKLQIRTSTAKNWLNAIYDVVKQTLTFDAYGPNIAGLISNGPNLINTDLTELVDFRLTEDPYNPGETTQPSVPSGDFDNTSDPIDVSTLPTLSAVDTRFISLFKPDLTQLQSLATYMWGASFDLETFKKLFNDPMAAILGLSIVPVDPPAAVPAPITLGNITTTISMPKITSQYVQVPCGTLNVNEYWGAYLDYSPFTKLEIYLPYIGVQTLDADDIMGRSVEVVYNIDVLSGACVAQLKCGDSVLYSFAGSCAVSIPITGRDWTNMINGIIGVATAAAGIAVAGATGGASVAAAAAGGALSQTANSLSSMKPTVQKSGTMAAGSGLLAIQKPYLILTRPRQALPENQNKYTGYPSFITAMLGDLTGMTYVYEIHLENVNCTQAEQAEIETLLKNGVIL